MTKSFNYGQTAPPNTPAVPTSITAPPTVMSVPDIVHACIIAKNDPAATFPIDACHAAAVEAAAHHLLVESRTSQGQSNPPATGPVALNPIAIGTKIVTRPATIVIQSNPKRSGCCSAKWSRALPAALNMSREKMNFPVLVTGNIAVRGWVWSTVIIALFGHGEIGALLRLRVYIGISVMGRIGIGGMVSRDRA